MRYSRKKIEEIKKKIPQIAYDLFEQYGMDEVTMQRVAQESNVGVATMYRYYGTKAQLVVDAYIYKWNKISEEVTKQYKKAESAFTLYEDFEFCLNSVLYVYQKYSGFLRFIQNFTMYVQQDHVNDLLENQILNLSNQAMENFEGLYQSKIQTDTSICKDVSVQDLYVATILSLYYTATKFSKETLVPLHSESEPVALLELQKNMYLNFIQNKTRS